MGVREPADKMGVMLAVDAQTNHFDLCDCIQGNLSFHIGTLLILRERGGKNGRRGKREKGRRGEGEKGRRGEGEKGRRGEGEKGRRGEGEKGRRGEGIIRQDQIRK